MHRSAFGLRALVLAFAVAAVGALSPAHAQTSNVEVAKCRDTPVATAAFPEASCKTAAFGLINEAQPTLFSEKADGSDAQYKLPKNARANEYVAVTRKDADPSTRTWQLKSAVADYNGVKFAVVAVVEPPPVATGTGTATLKWTAPTQNTDGSAYTDPQGYQVYIGVVSPPTTKVPSIVSPGITTYSWAGLAPNTYYFAVSAVNAGGRESALSEIKSVRIDAPVIVPKTPNAPGSVTISATISTP